MAEVERLADAGVLEINLVSQDTISWGRDLPSKPVLSELVRRIGDVKGVRWVRLFYLYPEKLGDDLIDLFANHPRVVPYIDMPLQHAADGMLRRMRRGHGGKRLYELVERLRKRIDGLTMRTAFIVGHPGETDAEFEELLAFIRFSEFDRVGVFRYSDEPSARAFHLDAKVPPAIAAKRARKLMSVQRAISKKKNRALVGRELEVLVEGPSEESELVMTGRHAGQAPEIDGIVYLSGGPVLPGELRRALITQATDYDLLADVIDDESLSRQFAARSWTARASVRDWYTTRATAGACSAPGVSYGPPARAAVRVRVRGELEHGCGAELGAGQVPELHQVAVRGEGELEGVDPVGTDFLPVDPAVPFVQREHLRVGQNAAGDAEPARLGLRDVGTHRRRQRQRRRVTRPATAQKEQATRARNEIPRVAASCRPPGRIR